jgi:hypothetical protein
MQSYLSMNSSTLPLHSRGSSSSQAGRGAFHIFRVRISTGDAAGAGTDSRIFLTLIGVVGQSPQIELVDSLAGDNKFERGNTDEFALRVAKEIGDVTRIVLRSDASALGSDWLVNRVVVTNCQNNNQYTFDCEDCWIRDTMPHEFICSERIKRDVQLEHVADNSGLLLTARLPLSGKCCIFTPQSLRALTHLIMWRNAAGVQDELLEDSGSGHLSCILLLQEIDVLFSVAAGTPSKT